MLIFQSLEKAIGDFGGRRSVMGEEYRVLTVQDAEHIAQGHVSNIGIRIVEFPQQAVEAVEC